MAWSCWCAWVGHFCHFFMFKWLSFFIKLKVGELPKFVARVVIDLCEELIHTLSCTCLIPSRSYLPACQVMCTPIRRAREGGKTRSRQA